MTTRRLPRPLGPGMSVAILSPSLSGDPNAHPKALEQLRKSGLSCLFRDTREEGHAPFIASDETRAHVFLDALADPAIDAILFARGGYGAARILPWLRQSRNRSPSPLICGLSDITNLHSWLYRSSRAISFHGPHLRGLDDPKTFELFWQMASGQIREGDVLPLGESMIVRDGEASGILVGGNLETLSHLCGSIWLPESNPEEGWIVLLEDIDEPMYAIDRALRSLIHAGYLAGVKGIVLGPFMGSSPRPDDPAGSLEDLVREALPGIPIVTASLCGHATPMATWPLGVRILLSASAGDSPRITLLEDPFDRS